MKTFQWKKSHLFLPQLCCIWGSFLPTFLSTLFTSVQPLSPVQLFVTPWTAACQTSLSITSSQGLLKLMSIESVMPSNHLMLCHPLLLLHSIFPSSKVFSNGSVLLIRWPKNWSFSLSISPSNEYLGLISFRIDWLDPLTVQGTLTSCLQHHSSKASILCCSAFFIVQLSYPYMTAGKTIALIRWAFVGKVMHLLFNMMSRLVFLLSFNFMTAVTICSDFGAPTKESLFALFPHLFAMKWWDHEVIPWS